MTAGEILEGKTPFTYALKPHRRAFPSTGEAFRQSLKNCDNVGYF
jgi:hypothetical protein